MATQHHCGDEWVDGGVDQCGSTNHGQRVKNQPRVRMSGKQRRKMDQATGSRGIDRGTHISGHEGG